MKKFNLQKALEGAKVVTRAGKDVTQLTIFNIGNTILLAAVIDNEICKFLENGTCDFLYNGCQSNNDLFMDAPEIWVNIYYSKEKGVWGSQFYESKEEAKENIISESNYNYQTTISIEL